MTTNDKSNKTNHRAELRAALNAFLKECNRSTQWSREDLLRLKSVLSKVNNLITMEASLAFVDWLEREEILTPDKHKIIKCKVADTSSNSNGYDVEFRKPFKLIAEVKCNNPAAGKGKSEGKVYGGAQQTGIKEDIKRLRNGKGKAQYAQSRDKADKCLKFMVFLQGKNIEAATRRLVKNMKKGGKNKNLVFFDDVKNKPFRKDKIYIVFV